MLLSSSSCDDFSSLSPSLQLHSHNSEKIIIINYIHGSGRDLHIYFAASHFLRAFAAAGAAIAGSCSFPASSTNMMGRDDRNAGVRGSRCWPGPESGSICCGMGIGHSVRSQNAASGNETRVRIYCAYD